jgi:antitoxin (DNA-binding transcriptional repressor) of toxin-antitoxin stability system
LDWLFKNGYNSHMKTVTLTQLKNNFSALMDLVRRGKTSLLVYDRTTPVIKVIYAGGDDAEDGEHSIVAQRLERAGLLKRAPAHKFQWSEVASLRVRPKKKADIVAALLADRAEDR